MVVVNLEIFVKEGKLQVECFEVWGKREIWKTLFMQITMEHNGMWNKNFLHQMTDSTGIQTFNIPVPKGWTSGSTTPHGIWTYAQGPLERSGMWNKNFATGPNKLDNCVNRAVNKAKNNTE